MNMENSRYKHVYACFTNPVDAHLHGGIMKINKKDHNFYGFDTDKMCEVFEGDLTYLNTFCVKGAYLPVAVFHNAAPNIRKGHMEYMLAWVNELDVLMVSGMDADEMEEYRYQRGMYCPNCGEVIYSVNRHDYRKCKCDKCMVDGGKDYFRSNMAGTPVKIDLLTDDVTIIEGA